MKLSIGVISEDSRFAKMASDLLEPNFLVSTLTNEEELYLWLDECGDEISTLVIDRRNNPAYNGLDIVATVTDKQDGWPDIHCIIVGDESHSYENRTSIWQLASSADFIGHPFSIESLVGILSGQLTRVRD